VVLSSLLHAAGTARTPLPAPLLLQLATTLGSEDLWGALLLSSPAPHSAASGSTAMVVDGGGSGAAGLVPPGTAAGLLRDPAAGSTQLLAVVHNLLRWQGGACGAEAKVSLPLCRLLLAVAGTTPLTALPRVTLTADTPPPAAGATGASVGCVMRQLVVSCGVPNWETLLAAHAQQLLEQLLPSLPTCVCVSGCLV
jgi:hypothetical protein